MVLGMVQTLTLNKTYGIYKVDKTPFPLRVCAPIEALDTSMHSFVVSKVHTPSVAKQRDSKCFREAPVALFHLTIASCSFVMMALVHFQCTASASLVWRRQTHYALASLLVGALASHGGLAPHGNSTLRTFNTAPSSSKASWHGLYKPLDLHAYEGEKKRKISVFAIIN